MQAEHVEYVWDKMMGEPLSEKDEALLTAAIDGDGIQA